MSDNLPQELRHEAGQWTSNYAGTGLRALLSRAADEIDHLRETVGHLTKRGNKWKNRTSRWRQRSKDTVAIVRAVAALPDPAYDYDRGDIPCPWCKGHHGIKPGQHAECCPWLRARKWAHTPANQSESPTKETTP